MIMLFQKEANILRARSGHMEEETETNTFIFVIKFLLEYSCFIMCLFLQYSKLDQPYIYIYPLPFGLPSHSDHHRVLRRVPWSIRRFSLVTHFTRSINSLYLSVPTSQFLLACPVPLGVHIFVLYISVSISVLQVRSIPFFQIQYIYALMYEICFSLFDFTLYGSSISKRNKQSYQKMGRRACLLFKRTV